MTPEQSKQLAKQAGVQPYEHSQSHRESISFTPVQLAEFARLVRESVLDEAADLLETNQYATLADHIRSLK